jgi:hypothetical protein
MIENGGFKSCVKCNTPKSVEFFYKLTPLRKNDDGYDYYCKSCRNALVKNNYHNNKVRCSICDKPNYAKSLCRSHYLKERRNNK